MPIFENVLRTSHVHVVHRRLPEIIRLMTFQSVLWTRLGYFRPTLPNREQGIKIYPPFMRTLVWSIIASIHFPVT